MDIQYNHPAIMLDPRTYDRSYGESQKPKLIVDKTETKGYYISSLWPLENEVCEDSQNNDSGVSPGRYHSDASGHNTSPQSSNSEPRSDDSGVQTSATIALLACPVNKSPRSPDDNRISSSQAWLRASPSKQDGSSRLDSPNRPPTPTSNVNVECQRLLEEHSLSPSSSTENYEGPPLWQRKNATPGVSSPRLSKPLKCPLCSFVSRDKMCFYCHIMTMHGSRTNCLLCDFIAEDNIKLNAHLLAEHSNQELNGLFKDKSGTTVPKINSQGKVKVFGCKQCNFRSLTNFDFWEHSRRHIKPGKELECPHCPFVTAYKHHLEYHLLNHAGYKPFKCHSCNYSCVSKSMLNSHLKSHSEIRQYVCATCGFEVKYCHSLKLHLRKHRHKPAMVLDPDGTPNPLPVVDVYGTKRGPKRPKKSAKTVTSHQPTMLPSFQRPPHYNDYLQTLNVPYHIPFNHVTNPMFNEYSVYSAIDPVSQSLVNIHNGAIGEYLSSTSMIPKEEPGPSTSTETKSPVPSVPLDLSTRMTENDTNQQQVRQLEERNMDQEPQQIEINMNQENQEEECKLEETNMEQESQLNGKQQEEISSAHSAKNRRKGKAFKLEQIACRLKRQNVKLEEEDYEYKMALKLPRISTPSDDNLNTPVLEEGGPIKTEDCTETVEVSHNSGLSEDRKSRWTMSRLDNAFDCPHCDILFGDVIMHTMHMGYHGYNDPFTCNKCGEDCHDKLQFLHHFVQHNH